MKMLSKTVWVICDNDGGRGTDMPLIGHVYATARLAKQHAQFHGYVEEWYPIRQMTLQFADSGEMK